MDPVTVLTALQVKFPWLPLAITLYLVFVQTVKGLRDALDKTPKTDDNVFERAATIIVKTGGYLIGLRPKETK